ncbi:hypothetical protein [Actinomadura harenae]|uniref:hypothetical protein n=1 Tax=Actinomadura harenae TaxID=2483351 RepID=UPI0013151F21|nr:hypothetical protein [Actinomadura harenae]
MRIGPSRIRIAAAAACVIAVPLAHWSATVGLAALTGVLAAAQLAEHIARTRRTEPAAA